MLNNHSIKAAPQTLGRIDRGLARDAEGCLEDFAPAISWEEPILFDKLDTPEIPSSLLPGWLCDFALALSTATQTPPAMATVLSLSALASCVQGKFEVGLSSTGYSEPLCVWFVVALPPGSRKTEVLKTITKPLRLWEKQEALRMKPEIDKASSARTIACKRIDELEKKASKEDDTIETERLVEEIAMIKKAMPPEIRAPRIWTSDVTAETLQNLLVDNNERMSVLADEGGIFEVMTGLYSDGKVNMDVFLQAHAASPVRVNRQGRTADLEAPTLTFGIAVQPKIISDLGSGNKKKMRGIGALGRFLYVIPESNIGARDVRRNIPIPVEVEYRYSTEVHKLLAIRPTVNEFGQEVRQRLTLSESALESWYKFADYIEKSQGNGRLFEHIQDWTSKLPGASLRIAGLLHLAEFGVTSSTIEKPTIEKALDLCDLLICHAQAAFSAMSTGQDVDDARYLLNEIKALNKPAVKRTEDLYNKGRFKEEKAERLDAAIKILIDRHILSDLQLANTRKPTKFYWVNPALLSKA